MSQQEAVREAVAAFRSATKPVLLAGPRLRVRGRRGAFCKLADAAGCAVAVTPDAKGMFPEDHPGYIGE
jgi:thiamine pyrophosphate-dependent acetolactate synthase large subunit-like protein